MQIKTQKTRLFKPNEPLLPFLNTYFGRPKEGDILVVTSKIVALAEGRVVYNNREQTKIALIKQESDIALPTKHTWLTLKDGVMMAAAGIDESNANKTLILLPKDSFATAKTIQKFFGQKSKLKKLGVLITDSRCIPLRAGVIGVALGYAGFKGIKDYRGTPDLFGRKFTISQVDVADCLASAAVLLMGEGREKCPIAIIKNAPVIYTKKINQQELLIDSKDDMFTPLFAWPQQIRD